MLNKFFGSILMYFTVLFLLSFSTNVIALTVISEKGAMVYYNNYLIGAIKDTSISFNIPPEMFPGLLKVVKPGYLPFEKEITEDDKDGTIIAYLTIPGYLTLNVDQKDAEVYINGVKYPTNVKHLIKPGTYELIVSAPGFTTQTIKFTVGKNEEKVLNISLKKTVTLTINSNEKIPNVFFGERTIEIPNVIEVLPGTYRLILPNKYVNNIQEFQIPPVDKFSIAVNTEKKYNLRINGEPENAYVKLNDKVYKLPLNIDLPQGKYTVEIFAEGYVEETMEIELSADKGVTYSLNPIDVRKFNFLQYDEEQSYKVELDGFTREKVVPRVYFVTIKDKEDKVVWVGFSDSILTSLPTTIPVLVSSDFQVILNGKSYQGPAILQVQKGQKISVYNRLSGTETLTIDKLTVFDTPEKCLVNIYTKTSFDVFWDGKYIGKTPIYLFITNAGKHEIVLKKNEQEIFRTDFVVSMGKLNEISIDK